MRPALGLRVGEGRSGGLRKRASWVGQSGAVRLWSGLRHLRFTTPARAALPDSRCGVLGRFSGPVHDRARLIPQDTGQSRRTSAHVPPGSRAGLPRPPEQPTPIAVGPSSRCPEQRLVGVEQRARSSLGGGAVE